MRLIAVARNAAPEVPVEIWHQVETAIRRSDLRATRIYVAARPKGFLLAQIEASPPGETLAGLAERLGITQRRVRQLWQLTRKF